MDCIHFFTTQYSIQWLINRRHSPNATEKLILVYTAFLILCVCSDVIRVSWFELSHRWPWLKLVLCEIAYFKQGNIAVHLLMPNLLPVDSCQATFLSSYSHDCLDWNPSFLTSWLWAVYLSETVSSSIKWR